MLISVWRHPVVWRKIVWFVFILLCGFQWFFFVELSRNPPYTGPAQVGAKVPAFKAVYADGKPFSNADLEGDQRAIILFYRGRW
jgi:hypothetical protein